MHFLPGKTLQKHLPLGHSPIDVIWSYGTKISSLERPSWTVLLQRHVEGISLVPIQELPLPCWVEAVAGEVTGEVSTGCIIQTLMTISSWISFSSQWLLNVSLILFLICTGIVYINFFEFLSNNRAGEPQQELVPGMLLWAPGCGRLLHGQKSWRSVSYPGSAFPIRALETW